MNHYRLLLIEDDPDSGEAMRLLLQMEGFHVEWVGTGEDALALFRSEPGHPVDLILLDLMLPDMDGAKLIERLAEVTNVPPVVIHSASALAEAQAAGRRIGAAAVLRKPTEWARMKEVLGRVCVVGSS